MIKINIFTILSFVWATTGIASFAGELSFLEALEVMTKKESTVKKAQEDLSLTETDILNKKSQFLPNLELGAGLKKKGIQNNPETSYGFVKSNLNIYRFGYDSLNLKKSEEMKSYRRIDLEDIKIDAEKDNAELLINYLTLYSKVQIGKERLVLKNREYEVAQKKYQRGLTSREEVQKIEIDINTLKIGNSDLEESLKKIQSQLLSKLGQQNIESKWPWSGPLGSEKFQKEFVSKVDFTNHPSYQKALKLKNTLKLGVDMSKKKFLPSIDLSYEYSRSGTWNSFLKDDNSYSVGLDLTIPIFDRLDDYYQYRENVNQMAKSELDIRDIKNNYMGINAHLKNRFNNLIRSIKLRKQSASLAKSLYQKSTEKYNKGLISVDDLTTDYDRMAKAQGAYIEGMKQGHLITVEICYKRGLSLKQCLQDYL